MKISTGLVSVVAANVSTTLHALGAGKRATLKRIRWINRTGGNGFLRIGYTSLAAAFVQVHPDILMINGIDDELELPVCGNGPQGFSADTTAGTGSLGNLIVQSTVGAAAPTDVQLIGEVEET